MATLKTKDTAVPGSISMKMTPKVEVFRRMSFFLDLKDYANTTNLMNDIRCLGGSIETFLSRDVKYVVTNRPSLKHAEKRNIYSSSSLSNRSFSPATLSSSSNQESARFRQNTAMNSRAAMLLEKAKQASAMTNGVRDVLKMAREWGSKIVHVTVLNDWIKKLKSTHRAPTEDKEKNFVSETQRSKLTTPFLKYEDDDQLYSPQYRQLDTWPVFRLNDGDNGVPSTKKDVPKKPHRRETVVREHQHSSKSETDPVKKSLVAAGRKPGFCEMCSVAYVNVYEHVDTGEHKEFVTDESNFAILDEAILALPNFEDYRRKSVSESLRELQTLTPNKVKRTPIQRTTSTEKMKWIKRKLCLHGDFNFVQPPNKKMIMSTTTTTDQLEVQLTSSGRRLPLRDVNSVLKPSPRKAQKGTSTENTSPTMRLLRSTAKRRTSSSSSPSQQQQSSPTMTIMNNNQLCTTATVSGELPAISGFNDSIPGKKNSESAFGSLLRQIISEEFEDDIVELNQNLISTTPSVGKEVSNSKEGGCQALPHSLDISCANESLATKESFQCSSSSRGTNDHYKSTKGICRRTKLVLKRSLMTDSDEWSCSLDFSS